MPGKYGPAGKWIHDRAHRIMKENKSMPKSMAYAIATQQAHKLGKSPKDFRTPQGVHEAKKKYDEPISHYQKTAQMRGFVDEMQKIKEAGQLEKMLRRALWLEAKKRDYEFHENLRRRYTSHH